MDKPAEKRQFAWPPLTPRGIAALVAARPGRLWLVQFVVALLAALSVVWFLNHAYVPVVSAAIRQLPAQSEIRHGRLNWTGSSPVSLADNRFLGISVDLKHEGGARSPSHIQAELGEKTIKCISLLGFVEVPYPSEWRIGLSRAEVQPWWGAWLPPVLAIAGASVIAALIMCWVALGIIYAGPVWLLAFFANRDLTLPGAWRLAMAALLPGALFLSGAIVLYGLGAVDLLVLGMLVAAHFLIGWIYATAAVFRLPAQKEKVVAANKNPFAPE